MGDLELRSEIQILEPTFWIVECHLFMTRVTDIRCRVFEVGQQQHHRELCSTSSAPLLRLFVAATEHEARRRLLLWKPLNSKQMIPRQRGLLTPSRCLATAFDPNKHSLRPIGTVCGSNSDGDKLPHREYRDCRSVF